jgi:hypothetical protein
MSTTQVMSPIHDSNHIIAGRVFLISPSFPHFDLLGFYLETQRGWRGGTVCPAKGRAALSTEQNVITR